METIEEPMEIIEYLAVPEQVIQEPALVTGEDQWAFEAAQR